MRTSCNLQGLTSRRISSVNSMANTHQLQSDLSIFNHPNRLAGFVQLENTVLKQPVFVQLGRHLLKANLVYWDSSPGEAPKRNQHGINQKQNKLQVHTSNTSNTQHTSKYRTNIKSSDKQHRTLLSTKSLWKQWHRSLEEAMPSHWSRCTWAASSRFPSLVASWGD